MAARSLNVFFTVESSVFIASLNLSVYSIEKFIWLNVSLKIQCSDYINGLTFEKLNAMIKAMDLILKNSWLQYN